MSSFADDLKQLLGDSVLVLFSRIAVLLTTFLTHTILVRNLEPGIFGTLSLALTIISVSAGFAKIGMGQTVARFISSSNSGEANEYISIGISVVLISGLLFIGGIYTFSQPFESLFSSDGLSDFLRALVLLVILRPLAEVLLGIIRGFEKTKHKIVYNDLLPQFISLPVLFYFLFQNKIIFGSILYYLMRSILRVSLLSLSLYGWEEWEYSFSLPTRERFSDTFSFAWPLAFESLVVVFLGSIDILMLGWLMSSDSVGFYKSIQPVSKTILFLLQALAFIYLPIATRYFVDNKFNKLDSVYKTSTRWVSYATFPLFLFYVLFGREFIRVIFTQEYVVASVPLAILSFGMYSRVISGPNGMTIKAINRTREDLLASIGALMTNILLNYVLIPPYGLIGAAIATSLGYLIYNVIDLTIIYKYTGVTPFHWDLFKPIIPTTVTVVGLDQLVPLSNVSFVGLVVLGILICIIHFVSIILTVGLTSEDKMLIQNLQESEG